MAILSSIVKAVGTLTFTGVAIDTQTVTVGGKVYTTQTTLSNSDGNVLIGASQTATCLNLARAINLGAGAGTLYAALMTLNTQVTALESLATVTVTAKVGGTEANGIASTTDQTNAAWGEVTLASGAGSMFTALGQIRAQNQLASDTLRNFEQLIGA